MNTKLTEAEYLLYEMEEAQEHGELDRMYVVLQRVKDLTLAKVVYSHDVNVERRRLSESLMWQARDRVAHARNKLKESKEVMNFYTEET